MLTNFSAPWCQVLLLGVAWLKLSSKGFRYAKDGAPSSDSVSETTAILANNFFMIIPPQNVI